MRTAPFVLALLCLYLMLPVGVATADDIETIACDSSAGWRLTDFRTESPPANFDMGTVEDSVAMQYARNSLGGLMNTEALLTGMLELQLAVQSQVAIDAMVFVRDLDGAGFLAPIKVAAGSWETIRVKPADFKLSQGSAVKKDKLDPGRLGVGVGVLDAAPLSGGGQGTNLFRIRSIGIVLNKLDTTSGDLVLDKNETITKNRTHHGNITVRGGATLKISAPRAAIHGDIIVEDGKLDFGDGVIAIPQHHAYQHCIRLLGKSSAKLRGTTFITPGALLLDQRGQSSFAANDVTFVGSVSAHMAAGTEATLDTVTAPGEFCVGRGATFSATGANGLRVLLELGKEFSGELVLPDGKEIANFKLATGLDVKLRNCSNVQWTVLAAVGAGGSVKQSTLSSAGGAFDGKASHTISEFRSGRSLDRYTLTLADRILRFSECNSPTWGLIAHDEARVRLDDCAVAGIMTFDDSSVELDKSACDQAAICANGNSMIRLTGSRVAGLIVARDHSHIVLERCEIAGAVHATGNATIEIRRCVTNCAITCSAGARLIIEPAKR
ncbi:MAG: hypothetical protein AB7K09_13420 [Planctomycetota bacterium]